MNYTGEAGTGAPEDSAMESRDWKRNSLGLDRRDQQILYACRQPQTPNALVLALRISKSSVYRKLSRLENFGFLKRLGSGFQVTDLGGAVAEAGGGLPQLPPHLLLPDYWPFLKHMPSRLHAAVAVLVLLAVIARKSELSDRNNPALILLGATMKMKTWLQRVLCRLLGANPDECLFLAPQLRERTLIARQDGHGAIANQNPALAGYILGIEEAAEAPSEVKKDIVSLIHGTNTIRLGEYSIPLAAVPILELNYKKHDGHSLEEKTGFEQARLRRCLVADFSEVELTHAKRAEAAAFLDSLENARKLDLPTAKKKPLADAARQYLEAALQWCLKREALSYVDMGRLVVLAQAAKTLFPDDLDAAKVVVHFVFTLFASTEFLQENWQETLAPLDNPTVIAPVVERQVMSESMPILPSRQAILNTSIPEPEAHKLAAMSRVLAQLKMKGVREAEFFLLLQDPDRLSELNHLLLRHDLSAEQIQVLGALHQRMLTAGLSIEQVESCVDYIQAVGQLGFSLEVAHRLGESINEAYLRDASVEEIVKFLMLNGVQGATLQVELENQKYEMAIRLEANHQLLRKREMLYRDYNDACTRTDELNELILNKENELSILQTDVAALKNELEELVPAVGNARREYDNSRGKSSVLLVLNQLLFNPQYQPNEKEMCMISDLMDSLRRDSFSKNREQLIRELLEIAPDMVKRLPQPLDEHDALLKELSNLHNDLREKHEALAAATQSLANMAVSHTLMGALAIVLHPSPCQGELRRQLLPEIQKLVGLLCDANGPVNSETQVHSLAMRLYFLMRGGINPDVGSS